jgi:hypothetical protein
MTKSINPAQIVAGPQIERHIRVIRGQKVLLDQDLALLYGVPTKILNQAVRRNLDRFPDDFMLQLSAEEASALRSQIVTLKREEAGTRNMRRCPSLSRG